MNEPTDAELAAQAQRCPFIRAALATGDETVASQAMTLHPPSKCTHVYEAKTA